MRKICLVDLDGTLMDYDKAMRRDLLATASPLEDFSNPDIFHYENTYPHIKARMDFIRRKPGWWRELELNVAIYNVWLMAKTIGFECHVLTQGPRGNSGAWSEKVDSVNKHLGQDTPVHIVRDKGLVTGDILIDDYPGYCEKWLEGNPRGKVLMPIRSYNLEFKHPRLAHFNDQLPSRQDILEVDGFLREVHRSE